MRLACRLTNGDGFAFEYATVDLTPEYVAWLLRLTDKAAELKQTDDAFYAVELFDFTVEYGSALGALDDETNELIDSDREWVQVPDNHRWPDDCLQSVSAATVVVTADSIHWRAAAKHGDDGTYFETPALTVARLREMFPPQETGQDSPEPLPHAKRYVEMGGGFCPTCESHHTEGDSVDFGGDYCTQRMYCLDCEAVWFDVYTLSSVEPRD